MVRVNENNYLEKKALYTNSRKYSYKSKYYDWWFVKYSKGNFGLIRLGNVSMPKRFIGKKIRVKIEVIDENERKN